MIRYEISRSKLKAAIRAENATWLKRAKDRTDGFRAKGFYDEASSIWSEIKPVYMKLQGDCKCVFCERKLESVDYGTIEQDVEHFRPKASISFWNAPQAVLSKGISFTDPSKLKSGYYLLSYNLLNYAASCKPCNSILKKDFFPIAGVYNLAADDPIDLLSEKAYIIYPIGTLDTGPEKLITFIGLSPTPVAASGHKRNRALVNIELFELDNVTKRKNLFRERAFLLAGLFPQLEKTVDAATVAARNAALKAVEGFMKSSTPHANCARSFRRLFDSNRVEAKAFYEKALSLISSNS